MTAPNRRWFRFSLWALFLVVTVFGIWLGWQVNIVRRRRAMAESIHSRGGLIYQSPSDPCAKNWPEPHASAYRKSVLITGAAEPEFIPPWRRWLGDEPIAYVRLPKQTTQVDLDAIAAVFPNAEIFGRVQDTAPVP